MEFKTWLQNGRKSPKLKFKAWKRNPVGATMRIVEKIYFGAPLFSLIQSEEMLFFILHLPGVKKHLPQDAEKWKFSGIKPNSQKYFDVSVQPSTGILKFESGHLYSTRLRREMMLSGNFWREIRTICQSDGDYLDDSIIIATQAQYYYDFMMYELVPILLALKDNSNYKILSTAVQPKFVLDTFELMDTDVIYSKKDVLKVARLIAPSFRELQSKEDISRIKQLFKISSEVKDRNVRILLVRGDRARTDLDTEDVLHQLLLVHKFIAVDPEQLSLTDQANLFSRATHIVGLHGGGLTNMLFSSPGVNVLEVFSHPFRAKSFEYLASLCGHYYRAITPEDIRIEIEQWIEETT
jgi:hypothetical protein